MDATPQPAADAFAVLRRDHARMEAQLSALIQAAAASGRDDGPREDFERLSRALEAFVRDGAAHESFEEEVLFPRLRPLPEFRQIVSALEFQHRMNRTEGEQLRACLDCRASDAGRELRRLAVRFVEMHRGHAVAEERALFPLAASRLTPRDLEELGREARVRLGADSRSPKA